MANANLGKNYPNSTFQFVNRLGGPAAIDQTTKPLRFELSQGADLVEFVNVLSGSGIGNYTVDVNTLGDGAVVGEIVADKDMTPEGEDELRIPFGFIIDPLGATGGSFTLSGGVDKP
jgi:hypothetical protein